VQHTPIQALKTSMQIESGLATTDPCAILFFSASFPPTQLFLSSTHDDDDDSDGPSNSTSPPGSNEGNNTANGQPNPPRKKRKTGTPSSTAQLTPKATDSAKRTPEPPKASTPGRQVASQKQSNGIGLQTLPAPPSFANRRNMIAATTRKGAPTELTLTPNAHNMRAIHPTIHSAPAVPASRLRLHQMQALGPPPTAKGVPPAPVNAATVSIRRTAPKMSAGPTPGPSAPSIPRALPSASVGGGFKSNILPPTPTPTSSSFNPALPLVPPTPSSLRHNIGQPPRHPPPPASPAHSAHPMAALKTAFMAPFESFFETLSDAQALKGWLQEQLTVARTMNAHGGVNAALIEEEVEKRVKPLRDELDWLRGRVGELEEVVLRAASTGKVNGGLHARTAGKERETPSPMQSPEHSPIPSVRRTATSSTRLDPVPTRPRVPSPLGTKGDAPANDSSKGVELKMETD
jgi:hypothetical protein